ncbi:MAG TPA: hypothetical protein VJ850_10495 [Candidatus Limnocylindrales bacterium]|nr:hypothetical protein [Candidatus Limnocylindrales bacterium]
MSQNVPNPLEPGMATEPVATPAPQPGAQPVAAATAQPAIPVSAGPVKSKGGVSNRALNLLLGGALVLAVAGIAFAAGRMTAPVATITGGNFPGGGTFNGQAGGNGNGNGNGGFQGRGNGNGGAIFGGGAGPTIEGTVDSISDTTLTLKTTDGQTIQIALNGDTSYHRQSDASESDVVTGSKVLVRINFQRGGFGGGPQATAGTGGGTTSTGGGLTANDVTVVP